MRAGWAIAVILLLGAGCTIDMMGTGPSSDVPPPSTPDGSTSDKDGATTAETGAVDGGGSDATEERPPPGPCSTTSTACVGALAAGWTPIAFASARTAGCPTNYVQSDLVFGATAQAGACTCACQVSAGDPPSCAVGSVSSMTGATCTNAGLTYTLSNGTGCTLIPSGGGAVAATAKLTTPPIHLGTCNPSVTKDNSKLVTSVARACEPPAECREDVCAGTAPAGFTSCIAHDGDVGCPAGPFGTKALVGPTASLTCGGCATCQNSATCGVATMRFYDDNQCAAEVASRVANGQCNNVASGTSGVTATYFKFDVATQNAACAPTSAPTTAAALDQPRTICCR